MSMGEVARRAGVSKGSVTEHFVPKADLIHAVVAEVLDSITEFLESRLGRRTPATFVAYYILAWVECCRTHLRYVRALGETWGNSRDETGRFSFHERVAAGELADGNCGQFSAQVKAVTKMAALDALLGEPAGVPEIDLESYDEEFGSLFERATKANRNGASRYVFSSKCRPDRRRYDSPKPTLCGPRV
ncbi:MAG: TetR/AcrR family transcriptional regulator [Acidimicrobiaceae bacterium]|nr:TetR/AcrR family transcriptional regulator [Acidimicrobiaceae bacterium]